MADAVVVAAAQPELPRAELLRRAFRCKVGPTSLEDLKQGASVPGDSGISPMQLPPWLDMARCERSRRFFERHAASLIIAWHTSLVAGFALPSLLSTLVFTGASSSPKEALERYVRTFAHLVSWHVGNLWDPASEAHRSVQGVRSMHAAVRSQMQAHFPGSTWISMYDMACVQSGFMGAITIVPAKFGIHASQEDMEDYVYFWRCVGYQLGVDDRFNLCSLGKSTSDSIVWEIINDVVLPDVAAPPAQYAPMADAYVEGMNMMFLGFPILSVRSTLALMYWGVGRDWGRLSFADRCRFYLLRLVLVLIGFVPFFRTALSWAILASMREATCRLGAPGETLCCPCSGAPLLQASADGEPLQALRQPRAPELQVTRDRRWAAGVLLLLALFAILGTAAGFAAAVLLRVDPSPTGGHLPHS